MKKDETEQCGNEHVVFATIDRDRGWNRNRSVHNTLAFPRTALHQWAPHKAVLNMHEAVPHLHKAALRLP
jgi:hypothetical protein